MRGLGLTLIRSSIAKCPKNRLVNNKWGLQKTIKCRNAVFEKVLFYFFIKCIRWVLSHLKQQKSVLNSIVYGLVIFSTNLLDVLNDIFESFHVKWADRGTRPTVLWNDEKNTKFVLHSNFGENFFFFFFNR